MSKIKVTKNNNYLNKDAGKVIFNTANNTYYCGMNTFKNQLRDAKIYHSDRYLIEAIQSLINSNRLRVTDIAIKTVELQVTSSMLYTDMIKY